MTALTNNPKIPKEAKPIDVKNTMGMTPFLANKLKGAQSKGFDHWYMLRP